MKSLVEKLENKIKNQYNKNLYITGKELMDLFNIKDEDLSNLGK